MTSPPPDGLGAAVFIAVSTLCLSGAMAYEAWTSGPRSLARVASCLLTGIVFVLSILPAIRTVLPGTPIAAGEVEGQGGHVPLPPSAHGRVVIVVKGRLREEDKGAVQFVISGAERPVEGTLERTQVHFRIGRQRRHAWLDRLTFQERGLIPAGVQELRLDRLQEGLEGPLHIEVYHDEWPPPVLVSLASLTLLAAGAFHARFRWRLYVLCAGTALGTGLFVHGWGGPEAPVEFAVSSLFMGAVLGALAGRLAARLFQGRRPAPTAPWRRDSSGKGQAPRRR